MVTTSHIWLFKQFFIQPGGTVSCKRTAVQEARPHDCPQVRTPSWPENTPGACAYAQSSEELRTRERRVSADETPYKDYVFSLFSLAHACMMNKIFKNSGPGTRSWLRL